MNNNSNIFVYEGYCLNLSRLEWDLMQDSQRTDKGTLHATLCLILFSEHLLTNSRKLWIILNIQIVFGNSVMAVFSGDAVSVVSGSIVLEHLTALDFIHLLLYQIKYREIPSNLHT